MWGVAAVALAAVLAGTIGTAAQLGPDELSPMAAAPWRSLLGAVGLLVAGLMDWIAAGQRPNRHWLGGVAMALAGVTLLSGVAMQVVGSGVALAVLAGCGTFPVRDLLPRS